MSGPLFAPTLLKYREAVKEEHRVMSGLFNQYLDGLRKTYTTEVAASSK